MWLYPIAHLNDIEELSSTESQLENRIRTERWDAGSGLHASVDHTQEFVIRDEPALSRLPANTEAWTRQLCGFQLYYTSGGYGGSDSEVRQAWTSYRDAFPQHDQPYYRILRVLIGLERPLWVVQHCGSSWQQVAEQKSDELKVTGAAGAQAQQRVLGYVRKTEAWRYRFDSDISYPPPSPSTAPR